MYGSVTPDIIDELKSIVGEKHVSTSLVDRLVCSRDLWFPMLFKTLKGELWPTADVVVWPGSAEEVSEVLKLANKRRVPVVTLGGGAGVCGGLSPIRGGIVMDIKRMCKVLELDEESLTVVVQAGLIGMELEEYLNRKGYTLGHYPLSIYASTIGGFLACRSAGVLSNKYGKIEDMVIALRVVLPTGEIIETKRVPRRATGPDLMQLFVGSEGILGVITEAALRIHPYPEKRIFTSYRFKDLHAGLEAVRNIFRRGVRPAIVRLYDERDTKITLGSLGLPAEGCLLILSFEGTEKLVDAETEVADEVCRQWGGEQLGDLPAKHWWKHRHDQYWNLPHLLKGFMIVDTIEVSAPWDRLERLYWEVKRALEGQGVIPMAHFSHFYLDGGSIYFTFVKPREPKTPINDAYWRIWSAAMEACIRVGGSISHHHGVGLVRSPWMEKEHGKSFEIIRALKKVLDPNNILNPGKLGMVGWSEVRRVF